MQLYGKRNRLLQSLSVKVEKSLLVMTKTCTHPLAYHANTSRPVRIAELRAVLHAATLYDTEALTKLWHQCVLAERRKT
jgi:hypothetical protein